ncbi:MAG: dTMP kinase [Phycisphaerales bacterium]|nr:dTMP kinase [Phycisphaerales bacterium]
MSPWTQQLAGRFLAFEGPDGSGKSTQLSRFLAWARVQGLAVVEVREPGGTAVGERIRDLLLDPENTDLTARAEMLLYMSSRAQLVETIIQPALQSGALVVADRFVASTCAYQGTAGGVPMHDILRTAEVATGGCWPDLSIIFDVDERTAAGRLNPLLDRMEQKGAAFHRRVREGYHLLAQQRPDDMVLIDATVDEDTVFERLLEVLQSSVGVTKTTSH